MVAASVRWLAFEVLGLHTGVVVEQESVSLSEAVAAVGDHKRHNSEDCTNVARAAAVVRELLVDRKACRLKNSCQLSWLLAELMRACHYHPLQRLLLQWQPVKILTAEAELAYLFEVHFGSPIVLHSWRLDRHHTAVEEVACKAPHCRATLSDRVLVRWVSLGSGVAYMMTAMGQSVLDRSLEYH